MAETYTPGVDDLLGVTGLLILEEFRCSEFSFFKVLLLPFFFKLGLALGLTLGLDVGLVLGLLRGVPLGLTAGLVEGDKLHVDDM